MVKTFSVYFIAGFIVMAMWGLALSHVSADVPADDDIVRDSVEFVPQSTTVFLPGLIFDDDDLVREFQARALMLDGFSFERVADAAGLAATEAVWCDETFCD